MAGRFFDGGVHVHLAAPVANGGRARRSDRRAFCLSIGVRRRPAGPMARIAGVDNLRGTENGHLREAQAAQTCARRRQWRNRSLERLDSLRRLLIGEGVDAGRITWWSVTGSIWRISTGWIVPTHAASSACRRRRILVSVGALIERKGFHRVIELLPHLRRKFPDLHYLIVGGPSPAGDIGRQLRDQVGRASVGCACDIHGSPQP